jgi:dihydrofolate synthase/folylpolyglutamate synthase
VVLDFAAWLERLEQLHPSAIDLGLARCGEVARRLDLLDTVVTTITVAGTNGKGSTVAVMEAILCSGGERVGAFTSPHLVRYNERIRVNGVEVSDEFIVEAFEAIDEARSDISLTYFEFNTLAALWIFKKLDVAFQLLEVGLGGRLDAVNIINADVAVVTAIGLDHQEWLGTDVETIAVEKCGIARDGRPCVVADSAAPVSVSTELLRIGAHEVLAQRDYAFDDRYYRSSETGSLAWSLPPGILPLNAAAGLRALEAAGVGITEELVAAGMNCIVLSGRRESLRLGNVDIVLDVAHNPDAAAELRKFLDRQPAVKPTAAIFAVMSDKDCRDMISVVEPVINQWYLPSGIGGARGQSPDIVAGFISGTAHITPTFESALEGALRSLVDGGRLIIFGSFFTVGEGMKALELEHSVRLGGNGD